MISFIKPEWSAPRNVHGFFTTREGGASTGAYNSLNLGLHVSDTSEIVAANRRLVRQELPGEAFWLEQVHSNRCIDVDADGIENQADASFTRTPDQVLAVMSADCLPILLARKSGDAVAVVHAGWRGLANGVIASALDGEICDDWVAWLGSAIGPCHYEVGDVVRNQFQDDVGFTVHQSGSWFMDLYLIANSQLRKAGVTQITGGQLCTFCDEKRFYSYRRDGQTGRMAGFIWFE